MNLYFSLREKVRVFCSHKNAGLYFNVEAGYDERAFAELSSASLDHINISHMAP